MLFYLFFSLCLNNGIPYFIEYNPFEFNCLIVSGIARISRFGKYKRNIQSGNPKYNYNKFGGYKNIKFSLIGVQIKGEVQHMLPEKVFIFMLLSAMVIFVAFSFFQILPTATVEHLVTLVSLAS